MTLRVVREGESQPPAPPGRQTPQDDPRVMALLERLTMGSAPDGKYIFTRDDATLLRWGLRGMRFTDEDLVAIETWLREHDPYKRQEPSVSASFAALEAAVEQELRRVSTPQWLKEPLDTFMRTVDDAERKNRAHVYKTVLRAAFTAFLIVRA